jgi:hypothetical protein
MANPVDESGLVTTRSGGGTLAARVQQRGEG